MNTKNFLVILLVVVAIFLGFKFSNKKTAEDLNVAESSQNVLANLDIAAEEGATASLENKNNLVTKKIVSEKSSLNWTAKKTVVTDWVDKGTVKISSGSAQFDGAKLVSAEAIVDMNTITAISTGSGSNQDRLTTHVKSADFFDVASYPTAKIIINSVSGNTANGNITIKGVTKPISFPISINSTGSAVTGKLTINRADFGVKYGSTSFFKDLADRAIVDDIFTVDFNIALN